MSERHDRIAWAVRVFASVQRVLPRRYRARHGADAEALFACLAAEAQVRRGQRGVCVVLLVSLLDLVRRAPIEHMTGVERRRTRMAAVGEIRRAVRLLGREPRYATAIVLTLSLAIGATTAIVAIADAVLARPLPYAEAGDIHHLITTYSGERTEAAISVPDYLDVVAGAPSLAETALYALWNPTLAGDGEPTVVKGMLVTSSFFGLLRMQPALGRYFTRDEDADGTDAVVVLSWGLWQQRFGGTTDVLGRTIDVNGSPHLVVGVAPAEFANSLPAIGPAMIYRPLGFDGAPEDALPSRGNESYGGLVRLAADVSEARANDEIASVMELNAQRYPGSNTGQGMALEPLREDAVRAARPALHMFLAAGVVVLLIAITNVVNLMLARGADRRRDLAMRAALGANRGRLSLMLVSESLLLAVLGSVAGYGAAVLLTRLLLGRAAGSIPLATSFTIDARVIAFTGALCVATGLVTGLVAALRSTDGDIHRVLMESGTGRGATTGLRSSRLRRGLVITQVGLCVILVISASLLLRSLSALVLVDPGFDTRVTSFRLSAPPGRYETEADVSAFYDRVLEALRAVPGVELVATIRATPLSGASVCGTLFAEEDPHRFDGQDVCAEVRSISADYLDVMRIPLVRGRAFTAADDSAAPRVGLVSESTAEMLWPGVDPIGKRFATGLSTEGRHVMFEVVGVVRDVKQFRLDEKTPPQTYLSAGQWPVRGRAVVLRATVPAATLFPALRSAVWSVDDRVPLTALGTLDENVASTLATPRFRTLLLGSCAVLALLLAVVGLYGVISGSVVSRRGELAIRMSLGARPAGVLRMVLVEGGRLAAIGIAIGLFGAFAAARLLQGLLFGVGAFDPLAFVVAPLLVLATCALAVLTPAVRATRVDPLESLRQ